MREILFRAKKFTDKEWVLGSYINALQTDRGAGFDKDAHFIMEYNGLENVVDSETVCQYTGLTDKNGRKIFEGDILKYEKKKYAVVWLDGIVSFASKPLEDGRYSPCMNEGMMKVSEVIGNIFDNPELIGGQP